jgi:hypothetical protein
MATRQGHGYPDFAVLAAAKGFGADSDLTAISDHQRIRIAEAFYPVFAAPTEDGAVAAGGVRAAPVRAADRVGWQPQARLVQAAFRARYAAAET